MPRLEWDAVGEHIYETGVNQGVVYPIDGSNKYSKGYAWNGLTSVTESPSGAESNPQYADNIKYLNLVSAEDFGATVEAFTYPDAFAECDGSADIATGIRIGQQSRKVFGLAFKTKVGNDTQGEDYGYKLHLVYGCQATPSEKNFQTVNESPEALTFSWEFSTTPVNVGTINGVAYKPTASLVIDSTKVSALNMKKIENALYGCNDDEFSETETYALGDTVVHETKTYECTTAVTTAGAWSASNWTEVANPDAHLPLPAEIVSMLVSE